MSRVLMVLVLAILLGLLAVMAHIVNPKPAPPPSAEQQETQQKQQQEAQAKAVEMEKNQRRSMMKMREEKAKEWSEKQKKIEREVASKKPSVPKVPTPAASAPNPMSMDISHDWFKKRQDGEQGLKELDKMQKELEEAAKKHRAASAPAATTAKPVAPSP